MIGRYELIWKRKKNNHKYCCRRILIPQPVMLHHKREQTTFNTLDWPIICKNNTHIFGNVFQASNWKWERVLCVCVWGACISLNMKCLAFIVYSIDQSQVHFLYPALNHRKSQRASQPHSGQLLTISPDLNHQEGKKKNPQRVWKSFCKSLSSLSVLHHNPT